MENKSNRKLLGWKPKGERQWIFLLKNYGNLPFDRILKGSIPETLAALGILEALCDPIEEQEPEKWTFSTESHMNVTTVFMTDGNIEFVSSISSNKFHSNDFLAICDKLNSSPKGPVTLDLDQSVTAFRNYLDALPQEKFDQMVNEINHRTDWPVTLTDEEISGKWLEIHVRKGTTTFEDSLALVRWARGEDKP